MTQIHATRIIFDLDGTLIDSAPDLHAATNHVLETIGRPNVTLAQVRGFVGHGALLLIEKALIATGGMDGYRPADLRPKFVEHYGDNLTKLTQPFPGAARVLDSLRSGGAFLGLCTNKSAALVEPILEAIGFQAYFGAIAGGDTFSFKKPDPRHLTETANRLPGGGPVLMVGDSAPDIQAAKAAGIPSVAVTYGYSQIPVEELGADRTINALPELLDFVKTETDSSA